MELWKTKILTGWKELGTKQWLAIFLLGILLTVIALPTEKNTSKTTAPLYGTTKTTSPDQLSEKEKLEKSLEDLLSNVSGIGSIQVLLSVQEKKDTFYGTGQGLEITGALIAAEGADNPITVREIQSAVQALYQLEPHKIKVMKLRQPNQKGQ